MVILRTGARLSKLFVPSSDADYDEGMQYRMIGYYIPRRGYHADSKQGLPFAGLASQKNYMSV
jgi:hypothetical protein